MEFPARKNRSRAKYSGFNFACGFDSKFKIHFIIVQQSTSGDDGHNLAKSLSFMVSLTALRAGYESK